MNPERLQQIEECYHAVQEAPDARRSELLADPELRREVESLVAERTAAGFLEGQPFTALRTCWRARR